MYFFVMPFVIDTLLLKTFIAVAETGSFSEAADIVGRSQSAVSLQIKKLEEGLGHLLFERSNRKAGLTEQGEVFLGYARRIMELHWEAYSRLNEPDVRGELTLGTPEDFASSYLPKILLAFAKQHPHVQLKVECDFTLNLLAGFKKGLFDIVLVKRDPEKVKGGIKVWREPLVWVAAEHYQPRQPVELILAPQPCIYRARALAALDRVRKTWTIAYTSPSLGGRVEAVRAGLGLTVLPSAMIPQGLSPLRSNFKLPTLADSEIALLKKDGLSAAGRVLAGHITASLELMPH